MTGQMDFSDLRKKQWYERSGRVTAACPSWTNEKRCGTCEYWTLLTKDEQPPEGWGVFGLCGSHRGRNEHQTNQHGYCQDWKEDTFLRQ